MFDEKNYSFNDNINNTDNMPKEIENATTPADALSCENSNSECQSQDCSNNINEIETEFVQHTQSVSDTQVQSDFYGGVAYTKNVDGESKNGYEWNANAENNSDKARKNKNDSSKGFRIFIGSVLAVFTLSVVTLTAMVACHVLFNDDAFGEKDFFTKNEKHQQSVSVNNPEIPASTNNFVAFDKSEFEGEALSIPQIAAKCSPSSVGIISQVEVSYSYPFGFGTSKGVSEASGSGFIYSSDGYIITNHHVIENAKKVTVILHDGKELEAEIIGSDSLSDIAVLKVTPDKDTPLIPMEIGNSDELVVGEAVVAIGCPAGIEFIGTVTDGIISAINRNVEITDSYGATQKTMTLIQTNATINHGNSGGPLINTRGQVIGINTLKLNSSSYEGIGFSIPMNGAMPIIKQLIEHGKVVERTQDDFAYGKGVIGITGSAISEDEAEYYNIPVGVLVVQIDKNSSAAKSGLRRGDIITHYNGKKVTTVDEINQAKGSGRAGEQVTVTVYRDSESGTGEGQTVDITFTLDSQK